MPTSNVISGRHANVIFMPGVITPAAISYAPLLRVLRDEVRPVVKELELYATDQPPAGYSLAHEVEGLRRAADQAGFDGFHLVGFSGGGAASLAFAAHYPERLLSLTLIEPAWIGNDDWTDQDRADAEALDRALALPDAERLEAFTRWHFREGVEPPKPQTPPGPPPPWMAQRPAGVEAIAHAFKTYDLDRARFRLLQKPVYYVVGSLSRPFFERNGQTLAGYFPDLQAEVYEGRSHFDPPHRAEPERFAEALRVIWA
jgi:pimeloyl-ACP methyl ester carboxylesterase